MKMAELKNQHFVPRVHLKNFSDDPGVDKRMINMINVSRDKAIEGASISGQCSKSYFYGPDLRMEKAIGTLEGQYAEIIRQIESGETATGTVRLLLPWVHFQHVRTDSARKRLKTFHDQMRDAIDDANLHWDVTDEELIHDAISLFFRSTDRLADLKVLIIKNGSRRDFVTSDAPAVMFSKWLHQTKSIDCYGLYSSGLCLYTPLSPRSAFLAYDSNVYNVDGIQNNVLRITSVENIDNLNYLLMRADAQNIYFKNWTDREHLLVQIGRQKPFRTSGIRTQVLVPMEGEANTFRELKPGENAKDFSKNFIATENVFPKPEQWFGFLKNKVRPRTWHNGTAVGYVRQKSWLRSQPEEIEPLLSEERPRGLPGLPGNPFS